MNCEKCGSRHIKLEHQKDRETGFWSNYWWCPDCEARVNPQGSIIVSRKQITDAVHKALGVPVPSSEPTNAFDLIADSAAENDGMLNRKDDYFLP